MKKSNNNGGLKNKLLYGLMVLILAIVVPFAQNLLNNSLDESDVSLSTASTSSDLHEEKTAVEKQENAQKDNSSEVKSAETNTEKAPAAEKKETEKVKSETNETGLPKSISYKFNLSDVPAYKDEAYYVLNNNIPLFTQADYTTTSFETYGTLDDKKRCTTAFANVGKDLMPTEARGSISSVKPTGWQSTQYDCVDGKYLYNRCHLIGFQLTGENANKQNLITGSRYLNVIGMLPFENMVADYVKDTGNHVLYRVDPIFEGDNLVASGVTMEGWSVEDNGEGICFYIYAYNVQPGVSINYQDGTSTLDAVNEADIKTYIINTNNYKFHKEDCSSVAKMLDKNKQVYKGTRQQLLDQGYAPCTTCNP